ncbi:hypothetical protein M407DRAFT_33172 [Tulasnella calospora MUT 4182]|uniref:Uncharacterized protein n=1 Tax=Tulasnella calospora MUT 4182 TaxID=1051891 RepID=A0A0C3PRC2_9AGAM|nr:hypothetical protein M407DRAFT_33172 [Tulasnella calospora MUT 4182]
MAAYLRATWGQPVWAPIMEEFWDNDHVYPIWATVPSIKTRLKERTTWQSQDSLEVPSRHSLLVLLPCYGNDGRTLRSNSQNAEPSIEYVIGNLEPANNLAFRVRRWPRTPEWSLPRYPWAYQNPFASLHDFGPNSHLKPVHFAWMGQTSSAKATSDHRLTSSPTLSLKQGSEAVQTPCIRRPPDSVVSSPRSTTSREDQQAGFCRYGQVSYGTVHRRGCAKASEDDPGREVERRCGAELGRKYEAINTLYNLGRQSMSPRERQPTMARAQARMQRR